MILGGGGNNQAGELGAVRVRQGDARAHRQGNTILDIAQSGIPAQRGRIVHRTHQDALAGHGARGTARVSDQDFHVTGLRGGVVTVGLVQHRAQRTFVKAGARRATQAAIAEFEARRAELEKVAAEKLAAAQALGEKLAGTTLKLTQKAGVDGRLFGSVTNYDIAEELTKQGFSVQKAQVRMPNGPIKVVGDSSVSVALHTDVTVDINVSVYGETA